MTLPNVYDVEIVDLDDDDAPLAIVPGVPGANRDHACENAAVTAKIVALRGQYPNAGIGRVTHA